MKHKVTPKKRLGQHFLKDDDIATRIVNALCERKSTDRLLEIGPGTGVLTHKFIQKPGFVFKAIDLDEESIEYLKASAILQEEDLILGDVLRQNPYTLFDNQPFSIVGNFPYNISSQIFFMVYENHDLIPLVVCMIQKEVAERIAAGPGGKTSGILSILIQAFYDVEYLFTVPPHVFIPPPKVQSAVIALKRNDRKTLPCSPKLFKQVVKQGFNNRRKTLRNALKSLGLAAALQDHPYLNKRAEQLSVENFLELCVLIEEKGH